MTKKDNVFGDVFEQMDKTFEQMDKVFQQLPFPYVEKAFEKLDKAFDTDFFTTTKNAANAILTFAGAFPSFPPVNVYAESFNVNPVTFETSEKPIFVYVVELALSGYKSENVDVNIHTINGVKVLVIESKGINSEKRENVKFYQRGIAGRAFKLSFALANNVKVTSADLKDGLLTVKLSVDNPVGKTTVENIPVKGV